MDDPVNPDYIPDMPLYADMMKYEDDLAQNRANKRSWESNHVRVALVVNQEKKRFDEKNVSDLSEKELQNPSTRVVWRRQHPNEN